MSKKGYYDVGPKPEKKSFSSREILVPIHEY